MSPETAAVVFGLASALTWGAGDFCGGQATSRKSILPVLALTEICGLLLLLILALVFSEPLPRLPTVAWSIAAGLAGVVGLAALYQGLSIGSAAVVAPISAVVAAALPIIVAALTVSLPSISQLVGFGAGLLGIWLVAGGGGADGKQRGRALALLAGIGFGTYFVFMDQASSEATLWPTALARAAATLVVLVPLTRQALVKRQTGAAAVTASSSEPSAIGRSWIWLALLAGALDAGGNAFFALAAQVGRLDVASVLASLYPASTVLIARVVLAERVSRAQSLGLVATLAAIALIAG